MPSRFAPEELKQFLIEVFTDRKHPVYGQVATVSLKGTPQVRTVHFHYLPEFQAIAFNAHIGSSKWKELENKNIVSGCYHDAFRNFQFRWEGKAELAHPAFSKNHALLDKMWMLMREEVRQAYWRDAQKIPLDRIDQKFDVTQRAPNLGTVLCYPYLWNIFESNLEHYSKGHCTIFTLQNNVWRSKVVSILGTSS